MRTPLLPVTLSLLLIPTIASAQESASSDSTPRAGQWGGEVVIGPSASGASLLRFQSSRLAWVLGADFNISRREVESNGLPIGTDDPQTITDVNARFGLRSYRESSNAQLRPVVGGGLRLGLGDGPGDVSSTSVGVYGELGAAYFVASHLSLGAVGELTAGYSKRKLDTLGTTTTEVTSLDFSGSLVRVMLSVYF